MAADDTHQRGESGSPADELLQAVIQDLSQGLLEGRVPPDEKGITLLVGGMLVSGYLTTSEAYCQGTFRRDADFIRALVARLTGEPVSTEEPHFTFTLGTCRFGRHHLAGPHTSLGGEDD